MVIKEGRRDQCRGEGGEWQGVLDPLHLSKVLPFLFVLHIGLSFKISCEKKNVLLSKMCLK